ncbi:MAG: HD domain-containing phosphohydrolase [Treponema sp.]
MKKLINSDFDSDGTTITEVSRHLRFSEMRYRRLFETARDGILILNAKTAEIEDVNPYLIEMLTYTRTEFLHRKLWDISSFKDTKLNKEVFKELQENRYIRYDDLPLETKDGRLISVEFVSNVYDCDGIDIIQCNIRDNSSRKLAEIALQAATRTLKILNESNTALINSQTEQILLDEYCRIAVQTGGYKMAWIGFSEMDGAGKNIIPMAYYGNTGCYSELSKITWSEGDYGNGPTGRAIRTMQVQVCENISADPTLKNWHNKAAECGYRSLIVLPFLLSEKTTACFSFFGTTSHTWSSPERELLQDVAADLAFGIKALRTAIVKAQEQESLRVSLEQTIQVIAETIGQRDSYTAGHQRRVASICTGIGLELGLSADRIHGLHLAATIHDLGKIGIPAEILVKPVKLSSIEYALVKEHVNIGIRILKNVVFPWPITEIIWQHHERLDGSGYPRGLTGDKLLLESKILAVADVVEAMASHRPYRPSLGIEAALAEIEAHRGTFFDAEVVDACVRIFHEKGFQISE